MEVVQLYPKRKRKRKQKKESRKKPTCGYCTIVGVASSS
jgi:hypothetical protein